MGDVLLELKRRDPPQGGLDEGPWPSRARFLTIIPCCARQDLLRSLLQVWPHPTLVIDDSPEGLRWEPDIEVLRTSGGTGFAQAVNLGPAEAERRGFAWSLVLNDDALPDPGCVDALLAAGLPRPGVQALGPVLRSREGIESCGIRYSERTGRMRQLLRTPPLTPGPVDALSGACMLLRRGWRFDPGFRHGFEDVELCQRIRRQGGQVWLIPGVSCLHLGGASSLGRDPRATAWALAGHLRLVGDSRSRRLAVGMLALAQVLWRAPPPPRLRALAQVWLSSQP